MGRPQDSDPGPRAPGLGATSFPRPVPRRALSIAAVLVTLVLVVAGGVLYGRETAGGPTALRVHAEAASPAAEDLYLKGLYYWNRRTPDDLQTLLGNDSSAVAHLRMAYVAHDPLMISLRTNELLRPLHHDPKFRQLLADMGLPPLD
jgi:hypothetical protein